MTVNEALTIASHANQHTALRVLAQAYRVEIAKSAPRCTCDYAGIEGERHKDFCEIEGGPHVECRYRIAELEAQQGEPTGTEWGVRHPDGAEYTLGDRAAAVHMADVVDGSVLVERDVFAPGPWRVSS